MEFNKRVGIGIEFMQYVTYNNIKLPAKMRERKRMFIKWYIERNRRRRYADIITELSNEILYIKEITLERLVFNEK